MEAIEKVKKEEKIEKEEKREKEGAEQNKMTETKIVRKIMEKWKEEGEREKRKRNIIIKKSRK